jgi:hypothetical protein
VIGAAGAVASQDVDNPATTITLGTTGQYLLTFPNAKKGRLYWGFVSAAGTIEIAHLTAFDPAAGTATLLFKNDGGTATAPAEGDQPPDPELELEGPESGVMESGGGEELPPGFAVAAEEAFDDTLSPAERTQALYRAVLACKEH